MGFVLLYEADQAIRDFVAEALRDEGHQVLVCTTLQALQRVALDDPTALALVDTWGPHFACLDDARRQDIRALAEQVPTVLMTTHAWAPQTRADELGLLALLSMPIDLELLVETISQQVARLCTQRQQLAQRSTMILARLAPTQSA